jgi:hypothetical protein
MIGGVGGGGGDGEGCSGVKRAKTLLGSSQNATATSHSSNSNGTTPKSFATSSCHQGSFIFFLS